MSLTGESCDTYAGKIKQTSSGFEVLWHTGEVTEEQYENLAPYLVDDEPNDTVFITSEWRMHSKIFINEGGVDREVILHTRVGKPERVCLDFSDGDYEGLGQVVYTMRDGTQMMRRSSTDRTLTLDPDLVICRHI